MQEILHIFQQVQLLFPDRPLQLASGGLPDTKWGRTSDVDIVLLSESYDKLIDHMPPGTTTSIPKSDGSAVIYKIIWYPREVNIYVTRDPALVHKSTTHRRHQIALLKFPWLTAQAIILKKTGYNTEEARAKVLGLEGDPFEQMLRDDLLPIAETKEHELQGYYTSLF